MPAFRDFDFHVNEGTVRVFDIVDVPRLDDGVFVGRSRHGDVVLHHYAWADRCYKVNVTTDLDGKLVESPATDVNPAFALNIDVATPMLRHAQDVFAVDLFLDVLVRADTVSYVIEDEMEARRAARSGLLSGEALICAESGLEELVNLIEGGAIMGLLEEAWPLEQSDPPIQCPIQRVLPATIPPDVLAMWRRWRCLDE